MFEMNSRSYRILTASLIYLVAIAGALTIATLRSRAKPKTTEEPAPAYLEDATPRTATKPYFSLSTHRTYGSSDNARLWIDYQGVNNLDFRVYQVKDPRKFFTELEDPHQMGEREEEEVAGSLPHKKSFLEKVRGFKRWAYSGIKAFVRGQLQHDSRAAFNQKFRKEADPDPHAAECFRLCARAFVESECIGQQLARAFAAARKRIRSTHDSAGQTCAGRLSG